MEEKSSPASLFSKRTRKAREKQLFFVLDPSSPHQILAPLAPVKASACRFIDSLPPEYNSATKGKCKECGASTSTQWRKGPAGANTLCNSCGLRWKKALKKKAKLDDLSSIETGLKTEKTADLGNSHHILLRPLEVKLSDKVVETTAAEKHQQYKKDEQNGSIPNEQPRGKLSL